MLLLLLFINKASYPLLMLHVRFDELRLLESRSASVSLTRAGLQPKERDEVLSSLYRIPRMRMRWFLFAAVAAAADAAATEANAAAAAATADAAAADAAAADAAAADAAAADAAEDEEEIILTRLEPQVIRGSDGEPTRAYLVPAGADLQLEVHLRALGPAAGGKTTHSGRQSSCFSAPEDKDEVFSLSLFLCSDMYMGVDQEEVLTFKTY
ncbi:activating signal cointegrator 1 complex subunit 3, putative [Eimeria praecox]|uniref:Activating signal cointegrator 1 complex subunit 3, putative n=1 Tax=Eimeria praecox TaxID=51316 RepID=U6GYS2_9EIME|nr:activating signal cointegrator 1 complex subunit 3, putative [Eimeria praecox]